MATHKCLELEYIKDITTKDLTKDEMKSYFSFIREDCDNFDISTDIEEDMNYYQKLIQTISEILDEKNPILNSDPDKEIYEMYRHLTDLITYRDLEYNFEQNGFKCIIKRSSYMTWNGYIKIPEDHIYYKLDENSDEFYTIENLFPGGITGGFDGFIGFDTLHHNDIGFVLDMGIYNSCRYKPTYKDYNNVVQALKNIAEHLYFMDMGG
jgi:hypothetical protein